MIFSNFMGQKWGEKYETRRFKTILSETNIYIIINKIQKTL